MSELWEALVAALADQGYGVVFAEDLVVLLSDGGRHHVPAALAEPGMEPLLELAILAIVVREGGRFVWPWPPAGGARPGMN